MGKNKHSSSLGKSIIRDRFGSKAHHFGNESHLHTSDLADGYDWNRINLRSVTEETSLEEFLATAELAGTEFTAEKLNIKFVSQESKAGLLSTEEEQKIKEAQEEHRQFLRIPRRPAWNETTSTEELEHNERESFLEWRRQLAQLQDVEGILMTPFERNLDFWRQLWRVIERSDIIAQIVDARNPLLFRSEDLEMYVKEIGADKENMLLINKADYLSENQREMWANYFDGIGIRVAFWSAVQETERLKSESETEEQDNVDSTEEEYSSTDDEYHVDDKEADNDSYDDDENENDPNCSRSTVLNTIENCDQSKDIETENLQERTDCSSVHVPSPSGNVTSSNISIVKSQQSDSVATNTSTSSADILINETSKSTVQQTVSEDQQSDGSCADKTSDCITQDDLRNRKNNPTILNGPQLIEFLKEFHTGKKQKEELLTVGLVGYPNVGKSSTINALLQTKKVPVSATPGRTKHFQTLYLESDLMLCDCPGLVMPTFVNTKADMIINGILPIDQMRDYVSPVALVAKLIPRRNLESTYGIMIPKPKEGEDESRPPTAHELLSAYGYMRGFMTHKGIPDFQRSSRHILKDFVSGKLLYCIPPTDVSADKFCPTPAVNKAVKERAHPQPARVGSKPKDIRTTFTNEIDRSFFEKVGPKAGVKGVQGQLSTDCTTGGSSQSLPGKQWKKHHNNKGKKQKLRRIYSHLDA